MHPPLNEMLTYYFYTPSMTIRRQRGFTLIELSIVLVIIGLIVGGILAGQALIHASELRSVVRDVDRFKAASGAFLAKYNCLPGDCAKAESFFGTSANGCPDTAHVVATGTCNGTGDGRIGFYTNDEAFHAWQQLSLAGMVAGTYVGTDAAGTSIPGINVPTGHIPSIGFTMAYLNFAGDNNPAFDIPGAVSANRILVGTMITTYPNLGAFATPFDTLDMDSKIDDGNPITGTMTVTPDGHSSPNADFIGTCAYVGASASDPLTRYNDYNTTPGSRVFGPACTWNFKMGM